MEWLLLLPGLIAWGWYSGMAAKERALLVARRLCERHRRQLLDETVALRWIRPSRSATGRIGLLRHYTFEFSGDGGDRRHGSLAMLGLEVIATHLDLEGESRYAREPEEPPPAFH